MFLIALAISSCKDSGDPASSIPPLGSSPTSYSYRGYNSKGLLVINGSISLATADGRTVTGAWNLECVVPGEKVGPQTGTGTLTGSIQGSKASLNLNPGWADNNVFLSGSLENDHFSGRWMWSTFVGPTSEGTFEALKK